MSCLANPFALEKRQAFPMEFRHLLHLHCHTPYLHSVNGLWFQLKPREDVHRNECKENTQKPKAAKET